MKIFYIILPGLPTTLLLSFTSFIITPPAPIIELLPIVKHCIIVALAPIKHKCPILT